MKTKNSGNIKLVSLLFLLGASSSVMLIPVVVQKESPYAEFGAAKSESQQNSVLAISQVAETVEKFKKDYIETPINKVSETTNQVAEYVKNPEKIITKEVEAVQNPVTNEEQVTPSEEKYYSSKNEPMIRVTKEMVDNCRIITEEYNKSVN